MIEKIGTVTDVDVQMEKMIAIATSLPSESKARKKLTGLIIDTLWKSLQHPPLSYFGNDYQYRTADGSYNVCYKWHSPFTRST